MPRIKKVDRHCATVYKQRFEAYFRAMNLMVDDLKDYGDAVALLAIHSAIALTDAVLIACTGQRSMDPNHGEAVHLLRQLCYTRKLDRSGVNHLNRLIAKKTDFSYGESALSPESDIKMVVSQAERFAIWAQRSFQELKEI